MFSFDIFGKTVIIVNKGDDRFDQVYARDNKLTFMALSWLLASSKIYKIWNEDKELTSELSNSVVFKALDVLQSLIKSDESRTKYLHFEDIIIKLYIAVKYEIGDTRFNLGIRDKEVPWVKGSYKHLRNIDAHIAKLFTLSSRVVTVDACCNLRDVLIDYSVKGCIMSTEYVAILFEKFSVLAVQMALATNNVAVRELVIKMLRDIYDKSMFCVVC